MEFSINSEERAVRQMERARNQMAEEETAQPKHSRQLSLPLSLSSNLLCADKATASEIAGRHRPGWLWQRFQTFKAPPRSRSIAADSMSFRAKREIFPQ
jgi:hypothetical protein